MIPVLKFNICPFSEAEVFGKGRFLCFPQYKYLEKRCGHRTEGQNQYIWVGKANFRQFELRFFSKSKANNKIAQNMKVFLVHFND